MTSPSTPIKTIDQLREYLYVAMQIEHATIPPYLTGAYTAKVEANRASIDAITAVAKEEMLHLTLAANLLNAVGGAPNLLRAGFVPKYPCHLPDGETDFEVGIVRFCSSTIDTFLKIERSAEPEESPKVLGFEGLAGGIKYVEKSDLKPDTRGLRRGLLPYITVAAPDGAQLELHYWSIGEFYKAIRKGFTHLMREMGHEQLFSGDERKQIDPKYYFSAGGELSRITNLDTALAAIELISTQGEGDTDGIHDMGGELAHFYRFEQISKRRYYLKGDRPHDPKGHDFPVDYSAAFPIKENAKMADYLGHPQIAEKALRFNCRYKSFLKKMTQAFNGQPDLFANSYKDMYQIKQDMEDLVRNPIPETGENAAPTFEISDDLDCGEEN